MPLWGQCGTFTIRACGGMEAVFGIGASFTYWPGFSAHAVVDPDAPFLPSTGYRSFLGIHADPLAGLNPDELCAQIIGQFVNRELKGKLFTVKKDRNA